MTTPYYADEHVTLYHGDCLQITEWLAADVLVTDPPYGIGGQLSAGFKGRKPAGFTKTFERQEWDQTLDVRDRALSLWAERPAAVFGSPRRLDSAPAYREVPLVWDKGTVGMGDVRFPWGPSYELIYVSGDGWAGKRESSVIRNGWFSNRKADEVGHPTPKPIGLMEYILSKAPAGVVADPFSGGGVHIDCRP